MKILFAASEAYPLIKTGGLGDVAYSLPKALKNEKIDVRIILPKYSKIQNKYFENAKHLGHKEIWVAHHNEYVGIEEIEYGGNIYYLVDNERYFKRDNIYGEYDDCERFLFFAKAIVETMDITGFKPDIIHCNDWQTGLVPIYLKERNIFDIKTIFTIHNLRFQGLFYNDVIEKLLEINRDNYFHDDGIKYYDMISFLKAGVVYSNYITTVSESYANEIKTVEYGEGIHGLFEKYSYKLQGVVNGIDKESYPLTKKSHKTLKHELQEKLGLNLEENTPIISIISRLDRQKGIDFIVERFDEILSLGVQFVLLGSGEKHYDFVEIMACPGGCVGGGGQPIHDGDELAFTRGKNLYFIDKGLNIRHSHENPDIKAVYDNYFEKPNSHKAHHLLHTDHNLWEMPLAPKRNRNGYVLPVKVR